MKSWSPSQYHKQQVPLTSDARHTVRSMFQALTRCIAQDQPLHGWLKALYPIWQHLTVGWGLSPGGVVKCWRCAGMPCCSNQRGNGPVAIVLL